jgi:hypothetical protein
MTATETSKRRADACATGAKQIHKKALAALPRLKATAIATRRRFV